MIFNYSINNILNESKILENKISNFKSNIDQKDDFFVFENSINDFKLLPAPEINTAALILL